LLYRKRTVAAFLLPGMLGLFAFYVIPFIGGIWYSMTDGSRLNRFVWFDNYAKVLGNGMFQLGMKNTWIFSGVCTPLCWVLALLVALSLEDMKNATFIRNALFFPYIMPSSAILILWLTLFDYGGAINHLIHLLGLERVDWLNDEALYVPIILMYLWKNTGICSIMFTSALQTVPKAYYEFARLEGAGKWTIRTKITLPCIAPMSFLVFVVCFMNAFKIFKEVYFIGGAYPDMSVYTLQNYMNNMFSRLDYQNVTSAAYLFAIQVFALFMLVWGIQRKAARNY